MSKPNRMLLGNWAPGQTRCTATASPHCCAPKPRRSPHRLPSPFLPCNPVPLPGMCLRRSLCATRATVRMPPCPLRHLDGRSLGSTLAPWPLPLRPQHSPPPRRITAQPDERPDLIPPSKSTVPIVPCWVPVHLGCEHDMRLPFIFSGAHVQLQTHQTGCPTSGVSSSGSVLLMPSLARRRSITGANLRLPWKVRRSSGWGCRGQGLHGV